MVRVKKERFQSMYKIRSYSERKLGLQLEKLPESDPAHRTYRTFQRNLQYEDMDYEVLEKCAEWLECSTDYLRGINDETKAKIIEELKSDLWDTDDIENELSGMMFDSDGILIETYKDQKLNERFSNINTKFKEWLSVGVIGKENSLHWVDQSTYQAYFDLMKSEGWSEFDTVVHLQMTARQAIVNELLQKTGRK